MAGKKTKEPQAEPEIAEKTQKKSKAGSKDFSDVLFSEFNAKKSPLENKKVTGVIDGFILDLRESIESFLGCKIQFNFQGVELKSAKEYKTSEDFNILTGFSISTTSQTGLFGFSYQFLDPILNILYGGSPTSTSYQALGKTGTKISERLGSTAISIFQKAFHDLQPIQFTALSTSNQVNTMLNKYLPDYFYDLTLNVSIHGVESVLRLIIPEALLESILDAEKNQINSPSKVSSFSGEQFKKELIDSPITLIAHLDKIKMKINDVLALKAGDLIPIHDPSQVFLSHNEKNIFKGTAGQADSNKVVKVNQSI